MKVRKFKVTTPLRVMFFTTTEWLDHGPEWARADIDFARWIDPSIPETFRLEIVW
jgi:hypothetical protein